MRLHQKVGAIIVIVGRHIGTYVTGQQAVPSGMLAYGCIVVCVSPAMSPGNNFSK
jgi:hypothetical protein